MRQSIVLMQDPQTAGIVPMWIYDRATLALLAANDAALAASGYARDELLGLTLDRLVPGAESESAPATTALGRIRRRDGTFAEVELCASVALEYEGHPARLALFRELVDPVTGLPSRAALHNRAHPDGTSTLLLVRVAWTARSSQRSDAARRRAARAAADAIGGLVPGDATLVCYAENTFAIRLHGGRARAALGLAKRLLAAFERPLADDSEEISGTPSVGIAAGGTDLAAQIRDAEAALEHAVASGTGVQLFDAEIARRHDRYATIERNLRHAVLDGRVSLVFQPIVSLRSAGVVGAEALMRWDCPGLGPVSPAEFIAIAEESRAILRLGEWVLREACAQSRRWQRAGLAPIRMAVNVSARQIAHPAFMRQVSGILESTSLAAEYLEIELTGPSMTSQDEQSRRTLDAVRRLGVRIAIDEFGTGYSSLRDLGALPVDTLKLARPFVGELGSDRFATEAARAAVQLAHLRGIRVVAVGVENAEHLEALRAMECDEAQGFLLGAPVTAETFAARLERDRLRTAIATPGA
jgi:EAL domain-containing protein (putative c-di-GMP-specific phosphodiesterase class I)/GGDEF domain-containing protein